MDYFSLNYFSSVDCFSLMSILKKMTLLDVYALLTVKLFNRQASNRSSPPEVFFGKDVLKICSKFTREHPCRSAISYENNSGGLLLKEDYPN